MAEIQEPSSPVPWTVGSDPGSNYDLAWLVDADGNPLVDRDCCYSKAVARRIVTAVNAHAELLASLKEVLGEYDQLAGSGDCGFWDWENKPARLVALAVIAKAESATPETPATPT